MFLKLFQTRYIIQIVIFLIISIILWIDGFLSVNEMPAIEYVTPLYSVVYFCLHNLKYAYVVIAFVIVVLEAILLNKILSGHNITAHNTFLPAFVFVLVNSFAAVILTLHPVLIANFFLILAIGSILKIYGKTDPYIEILYAGLMISIASLFYLPSIVFFILIWSTLFICRIYKWREWTISIIGVVTPYFFLASYYFLIDKLEFSINKYIDFVNANFKSNFFLTKYDNHYIYVLSIVLIFVLFISLLKMFISMGEKVISLRRKYMKLFSMVIIIVAIFFFKDDYNLIVKNSLSAIPIVIYISFYFTTAKVTVFNEIIFSILVLSFLFGKFFL